MEQQIQAPDIQRRNRELNEIAKSISELAELFKDLSALVIDQGTLLDSVEYNIEQTAAHVQEAVKELNVATRWDSVCLSVTHVTIRVSARLRADHGVVDTLQVPKEHRPTEMHLFASTYHLRPHYRAHLQTATPPSFHTFCTRNLTGWSADAGSFCAHDSRQPYQSPCLHAALRCARKSDFAILTLAGLLIYYSCVFISLMMTWMIYELNNREHWA